MDALPCKIESTGKKSASRAGLAVAAELLGRLGLERAADDRIASPGSNRGYRSGEVLSAFMLMLHEGGRCMDDVSHLHRERRLLEALAQMSVVVHNFKG